MSARVASRADSSVPSSSRSRPVASNKSLPPYEYPSFSLNPDAQRALAQLVQRHNLARLEKHFADATAILTNDVAEINERLQQRDSQLTKRRERECDVRALEEHLALLREKIPRMTSRMDDNMRKIIDGRHTIECVKASVGQTADAQIQESTQASNVIRARDQAEDEMDLDEPEVAEFTPTDPNNATQVGATVLDAYNRRLADSRTRYQSQTLFDRYATNNDYINFRRVVHDALHPEDDVPMPQPRDWFEDGGAPAPGITDGSRAEAEEDDDDDIAISRAKISTRCPITLQEFREPLSSTKCPHSFEKEAILQMIERSETIVGGRPGIRGAHIGGERSMRCPVGGCDQWLTKSTLHVDPIISRKIKRLQRAAQLAEEDDETQEYAGNAHNNVIDIDEDDGTDVDALLARQAHSQAQTKKPKKER